MKFSKLFILLLLVVGGITGCASDTEKNANTKPVVYTTVYPLQFLVEEIAGEKIEAVTIYPPGVDEHTYEPTSKELTNIADGEAFFYIGAGLEAFASTAVDALENQDVELIEIGKNEALFLHDTHAHDHEHHSHEEHETHDAHDHSELDPHIWIDPLRMIEIAEMIKDELSELLPEEHALFEENLNDLAAELEVLDTEFQQLISTKSNKKILVTHAAFGYWEERYDIEQISIHGLSTENEPSQKELIEIIDIANEYDIHHIIFEQNVSTRVSEVIMEEIQAETLTIHNLSVLTEDDILENRDYFSIMRNDLDVLNEAME